MITSGFVLSTIAVTEARSVTSPISYAMFAFGIFGKLISKTVISHSGCCTLVASMIKVPRKPTPPVIRTEMPIVGFGIEDARVD